MTEWGLGIRGFISHLEIFLFIFVQDEVSMPHEIESSKRNKTKKKSTIKENEK